MSCYMLCVSLSNSSYTFYSTSAAIQYALKKSGIDATRLEDREQENEHDLPQIIVLFLGGKCRIN